MFHYRLPLALLFTSLLQVISLSGDVCRVETALGVVQGVEDDQNIRSFKGIPYAQPPVGDLRWRDPVPIAPWKGVLVADHFGATPMQRRIFDDIEFRATSMSEDCLYLNVWAPEPEKDKALLPVLVYFHGGGLAVGDGSEARYDGAALAKTGIVVITVNYRLGIFGFFALPELSAESPHHASGNYGLLDQQAALQWVQRHIARFGGDPGRVTIAGQSAGSRSVCAHMASPLSARLFHGAIGQSGALFNPGSVVSLAEAEAEGLQWLKKAGTVSVSELRKLPASQLLGLTQAAPFPKMVIDGYFFTRSPLETFTNGLQNDVPLLAGWTSAEMGEGSFWGSQEKSLASLKRLVERDYGADAGAVLAAYGVKEDSDPRRLASEIASERGIALSAWKWLDVQAKSGGYPVFRYVFDQMPPGVAKEGVFGPPHSSDIAYAFGNLRLFPSVAWTEKDRAASAAMLSYFSHFIKTGNPNGEGLPVWPWLQASLPKVMILDASPHLIPEPNLKRYVLLQRLREQKK